MDWVLLSLVTFLSALIQSATGFGFGLIAVPVFLLILNSTDAIHMVMIIIFCLSLLDWFKLRGIASRALLTRISVGMLAGLPFGLYIFYRFDLAILKLLIALVIIFFSVQNLVRLYTHRTRTTHSSQSTPISLLVGYVSGMMSSSMAMPGPVVMMYLVNSGLEKTVIRATILTYFIFAYAGAIMLQGTITGISTSTWGFSLSLVPLGLLGVLAGHWLAHKINQRVFKMVVLTTLLLTATVMLSQLEV